MATLLFSLHISEWYYLRWRWKGIGWLWGSSVWPVLGCIWPLSGLFGPLFAYTPSVRPGGLAAGWPLCLDPLESHCLHTGSGDRLRSEPFWKRADLTKEIQIHIRQRVKKKHHNARCSPSHEFLSSALVWHSATNTQSCLKYSGHSEHIQPHLCYEPNASQSLSPHVTQCIKKRPVISNKRPFHPSHEGFR